MDWSDRVILLSAVKHGEHHALAEVLSADHGRWKGLVRGGGGRRMAGTLQPGNELAARWRARTDSHLGTLTVELARARIADLMTDRARLLGLSAACATLSAALPEREAHPGLFDAVTAFLDLLGDKSIAAADWGGAYVRLELGLLTELGYGLDLSHCAATGAGEDLVYVSPKSGHAVSREAGRPYADKLLALPRFLLGRQAAAADRAGVADGLALTGYFLDRHVTGPQRKALPARDRLMDWFERPG